MKFMQIKNLRSLSSAHESLETFPVAIIGGGPVGLLLSRFLFNFRIPHVIVERRKDRRLHPQAHYLNLRTMEILRCHCNDVFDEIIETSPPSISWRDFTYSHSITGTEYAREDHFEANHQKIEYMSPTNVLHLAQHNFEEILLRQQYLSQNSYSPSSIARSYFGFKAKLDYFNESYCDLVISRVDSRSSHVGQRIRCQYLIAADGASSAVRDQLGISMEGPEALQHLINVHFTCPGLHKYIPKDRRPAMLHFIFNQAMVAVYVSHNPLLDEWVCQIPFFPPLQQASDYTEEVIKPLLAATIFNKSSVEDCPCPIHIQQINSWVMNAQVARKFVEPKYGRIFLAGDSAHRFPPAGGFGMNTGIQDAHCLAWKLSHVINGINSHEWLGNSYNSKRRQVALENTRFSVANFENSTATAQALGLDPKLAKLALDSANSAMLQMTSPLSVRKSLFSVAFNLGLSSLKWLENWQSNVYGRFRVQALKDLIAKGKALSLIFPLEDIGFVYNTNKNKNSPQSASAGTWWQKIERGRRLPHLWLLSQSPVAVAENMSIIKEGETNESSSFVLSTIDLPSLAQQIMLSIKNHDSFPTSPAAAAAAAVNNAMAPPYIALVHAMDNTDLLTISASIPTNYGNPLIVLISPPTELTLNAVKGLCNCDNSADNSLDDSKLLETFRIPNFSRKKDSKSNKNNESIEFSEEKRQETINLKSINHQRWKKAMNGNIEGLCLENKSNFVILRVTDVTGQWAKVSSAAGIVFVDPEGHVM